MVQLLRTRHEVPRPKECSYIYAPTPRLSDLKEEKQTECKNWKMERITTKLSSGPDKICIHEPTAVMVTKTRSTEA